MHHTNSFSFLEVTRLQCSDFSVRLIYKLRVLKVNCNLRETFIKNYKNIYIVLLFSYKKQYMGNTESLGQQYNLHLLEARIRTASQTALKLPVVG